MSASVDEASAPWAALITVDRMCELHSVALSKYGGREGPPDRDCLDAAIGASFTAELYTSGKRHATVGLPFSGYLIFYVVLRHCLPDGNKRVAWMAAMDVLAELGLGVKATVEEAQSLIEAIISHNIKSGQEVTAWLAPRLYAL
jgi:prophage maintenance system killer protein